MTYMTHKQVLNLIKKTNARLGRYAHEGEHGVKKIKPFGYNKYIHVCPNGCVGKYVAEHTSNVCIVIEKCEHGYFYYYS